MRILFKTDCHLEDGSPLDPAYRLVKEFTKSFKPDLVIDGGDFFEFEYLGSFAKDKLKLLEGKRLQKDFDLGNRELDFFQKYAGRYVQIQGNHDERLERLVEHDPKFEGLVEMSKMLRLEERGIKWVRLQDPILEVGKLGFIHGYWWGKYPARKHLDIYKHHMVLGHAHKFDTASDQMPILGTEIQVWTIGCLCSRSPEWKKGEPSRWQNGFAVIYADSKTGRFNVYPVNINKYNEFIFEGRTWRLQ